MPKLNPNHNNRPIEVENLKTYDEAVESLARAMLPRMIEFFQSEEGKREFAEWKENKALETAHK